MALDVFLVRRSVAPPSYLGRVVEIPPPPRADDLAARRLDPTAPGFDDAVLGPALAGIGRPERLVPYGLVEPTAWERRFVAFAARRLGLAPEPGWDAFPLATGGPFDDLARAVADPLAAPPVARDAITLLEADDPELEAIAAARALRAWLDPVPEDRWPALLSDVVVLLPASATRRATWRRVLGTHGLAADAPVWRSLAELPVGRWLVALARLAGWRSAPVHRDDLRDALLAPLFTLPGGARRSDLRACLRSLRAHRVDLAGWRAHLDAWAAASAAALRDDLTKAERAEAVASLEARAGGLRALTDLVAKHLGERDAAPAGVLAAADALGARERLKASGVELAVPAYERAIRILRALAADEGSGAEGSAPRALDEALRGVAVRVEPRPRSGVRLLSYAQYDGRPARVAVLAGLEEGGHPAPPARLDPAQAALARTLGLESQDDELMRAARVAGCAAARATERVILAFSRTDEAGAETFAGALLAAVRRRKGGASSARPAPGAVTGGEPSPGDAAGIVATPATEATVRPVSLAEVSSPADLLVSSDASVERAVLGTPLAERWARAAAAARHLARIEERRNPAGPTPAGPYTGAVGAPLGSQVHSPSGLEKLGQCAFRYFVERILGAEEATDAGVDLDALETGSLLHLALARAAQDAIARHGAWVLNAPDEQREAHVARVHGEVCAAIDAATDEVLRSNPTLSRPLVGHFLARWKRALRAWLVEEARAPVGGRFGPGGPPDPDALDEEALDALAASGGADAVAAWRKVGRGIALVEAARKKAVDRATAEARWRDAAVLLLVKKGEFVAAATAQDARERGAALDALRGALDAVRAERAEALRAALDEAYGVDRAAVPRRAVASEWAFGDERDPTSDPKSTEKPLELALPGGLTMAVRGRIDRVDLADDRPDAAVVDYKTGREKSRTTLLREIGEGRHLQLPLYARAVDALLAGREGVPKKTRTVLGRLDFVRFRAPAQTMLEPGASPELVAASPEGLPLPGAAPLPLQDVVAEHLAHALRRLEAGVLSPVPRSCPQRGGLPCPSQSVCGALEASLDRIVVPEPQPRFVPPPRAPSGRKARRVQEVTYAAARPVADPPSYEAARKEHEAGLALARDVSRDVVVSAGAGSGKTTALVDRYVAALRAGARPSEILCITFTRKATAEMRSRVRERIVDLDRSTVAPEELARWIAELGTAPIRTLDAFAGEIAAELALEEVEASEAARAFADEFVADRLAAEAERPGPALRRLLERLPLARLKLALASLVEQEALLEPSVAALDADGIARVWEAEVKRAAGDLARRVAALEARVEEAAAKVSAPSAGLVKLREGLATAVTAFEAHGAIAGTWAVAGLRWGRGKDVVDLAAEARTLRDLAGALWADKAKTLDDCETAADVVRQVKAEAELAHAALATARGWLEPYREAKVARRLQSFQDVLAAAERAVRAAAPALVRSRFPFRHVLVDELQDTNAAQLRFVAAVRERIGAAPGSAAPVLFTVGDPKQSIYRFRGAEVDLFERHVSAAAPGSRATLSICWRSAPELTRALSRLFGRVFDRELDPEAAVPWEPLAPKGDETRGPRLELLRRDDLGEGVAAAAGAGEDAPDPAERPGEGAAAAPEPGDAAEAEDHEDVERPLVRRIRELLRDARPRPGESPVALLTHSWDRALHYGSLLQEHGIPCFVQGGRGLLATREVVDLLHWLRALERQDDDLCFVGVLRGGTIGVSDPGLYCLRQGHGLLLRRIGADGLAAPERRVDLSRLRLGFTFDPEAALARLSPAGALANEVGDAVRADAPRLAAFRAAWQRADRRFGVVPLGVVLRGIVEDTGYEAVLHARPGGLQALANLRSFLELVDAASEGRSPMGAVRELDRLAESGDDPSASGFTLAPGAAVTITVVHQAKGREWDVVIVPDLHRVEARDRADLFDLQRLVRPAGKGEAVEWVPSAVWENAADLFGVVGGVGRQILVRALAGAERAESRRLLYVACTRARERLVLGARWPRPDELRAMTPHDPQDLRGATTWLEVVRRALQLRPGAGDTLVPGDGVWVEGRDFAWVRPGGEGYGDRVEAPPAPAAPPAEALRRAARAVDSVPLEIVNPSALTSDRPPPPPSAIASPARVPALEAATPFASKAEEGDAFHRAAQLWSFRGAWDAALAEAAVRDSVGPARLEARARRVDAVVRALEVAQPALVAELRAAAERGDVFHEVDLGFLDAEGRRLEGAIDLLYRDREGRWNVLDYKTSDVLRDGALGAKIAEYHPQVAAYAAALRGKLPGGASPSSYGLWFVEAGVVVRWG